MKPKRAEKGGEETKYIKQKIAASVVDTNSTTLRITVNVNGLNISFQIQRWSEWIKNTRSIPVSPTRNTKAR